MVSDWRDKLVYFLWKSYKISKVSCTNVNIGGIPSLINDNVFFLDDPLIAPDRARQVLYQTDSSFW